jgi:hypothetical protein
MLCTPLSFDNSNLLAETNITGFMQGLYGGGLDKNNPTSSDLTASEARLQMRLESFGDKAEFFGRLDFIYDDYFNPETELELREGFIKFTLGKSLDFQIGRQIVTWGTGDLIFINDLFAKDYESFFIGRDDQYLKAPHNALRANLYAGANNIAIAYSPRFTPNRIPTGERLSYYNPMAGDIVGGAAYLFEPPLPESKFENGEVAVRFSRYFGQTDFALYGYRGFFKNPVALDAASFPYYPKLTAIGFSVRTPMLNGIGWLESGYFNSREDDNGTNPRIPNSSLSNLIGFEKQIAANLTVNFQYQNEFMLDYESYEANLPLNAIKIDEIYHLLTTRWTKMLLMETLTLSGFVFYSPSEKDFYGRFSVSYKYTDALTLAAGANLFEGADIHTDFGAFQKNDNLYVKLTYGY